jgi:hypothetical protein
MDSQYRECSVFVNCDKPKLAFIDACMGFVTPCGNLVALASGGPLGGGFAHGLGCSISHHRAPLNSERLCFAETIVEQTTGVRWPEFEAVLLVDLAAE